MRKRPLILWITLLLFLTPACRMFSPSVSSQTGPDPTAVAETVRQTMAAVQTESAAVQATQPAATTFAVQATQPNAATATNQPVQATAANLPTATPWPTAVPAAGATPLPSMSRISFASGATQANVSGAIKGGSVQYFVLNAAAGQIMQVSLSSPNNNVHLGIVGLSSGKELLSTISKQTYFSGQLPASQDYQILVYSPKQQTDFNLSIVIPVRIQFQPGAISGQYSGRVLSGFLNHHLAWAKAGQKMTVQIVSPNNDVYLTIYGLVDGQPLVRYVVSSTEWSGVLPGTQDYMIETFASGATTDYTLIVTIR